ncbi:YetF domain-containing protein, partial [Rhodococcus sp. NPDC057014]|uniref:YetF domain-containing protein n=1 Tax=Rhodococcus sp. NPDC057014 TaxID=3346000 RepID=UPI0036350700
ERMSLDDLMADARQKGIRRFDEIELAVLETNGRVSFFIRAGGPTEGAPEQPGIA